MLSNRNNNKNENFINFYEKIFNFSEESVSYKLTNVSAEDCALDSYVFKSEDFIGLESGVDELIFKQKTIEKTILYKLNEIEKEILFLKNSLSEPVSFHPSIDSLMETVYKNESLNFYANYDFENVYSVSDGESFFELLNDKTIYLENVNSFNSDKTYKFNFLHRYIDSILFYPNVINGDVFDIYVEKYDGFSLIQEQVNLSLEKKVSIQQYCYSVSIVGNGVKNLSSKLPKITSRTFAQNGDFYYDGFYRVFLKKNISSYSFLLPENTIGFICKKEFNPSSILKENLLDFLNTNDSIAKKIDENTVYTDSYYDVYFLFYSRSKDPFVKKVLILPN